MDKARRRQQAILEQLALQPSLSSSRLGGDDIVIVSALRTPICKARRGSFKDSCVEDILTPVLKAVVEEAGLRVDEVGDIVVGTVLAPGSQRALRCRVSALLAGFPDSVPVRTVNRQCSSGLQAVADVAAAIRAGYYEIGIGAGVECMSIDKIVPEPEDDIHPKIQAQQNARDCLLPMGITSENVAQRFGITREEQDMAAVTSHRRAAAAIVSGRFNDEIVCVPTTCVDADTGEAKAVLVSQDDGVRAGTDLATLAKLKPAFRAGGSTTAGNSSQISDGASAVLLTKRSLAERRRLRILGAFRAFRVVGVEPGIMGIGPAVAIPKVLEDCGLHLSDVSLFEINEAFASQYVYCCKKLQLDPEKVNVNGGAIALGHPLGATGARCVATLLHEMNKRGKDCRYGVVSMCIGTGMGAAAVIERGT